MTLINKFPNRLLRQTTIQKSPTRLRVDSAQKRHWKSFIENYCNSFYGSGFQLVFQHRTIDIAAVLLHLFCSHWVDIE